VASAVGGTVLPGAAGDTVVHGVTVDSRSVSAGDLFVALVGDRVDGHGFVDAALSGGASAALVRTGSSAGGLGAVVEVPDTATALLDLARAERSQLNAIVVGITGSTGKTCTKDFAAAVLGRRYEVVASPASFNNEVGLPITLLSADERTEAIICEMGSRGPGHIRLLTEIARPVVGVVTNVGVAHMELFGSPGVLRDAKAELPESLGADGTAVLNADDPVVAGFAGRTAARVILFGDGAGAEVRAADVITNRSTGRSRFRLHTPAGSAVVSLPAPGEHMVANALAAAAVGWALEVPVESVAEGLGSAEISGGRMEVRDAPGGFRVLDDAYNANPTSMAAALRAARWMAGGGRCIAVLGPMAELGSIAADEHERIGELAARLRIDVVVTVGAEAELIAAGAEREGVEPDRVIRCDGVEDAVRALAGIVAPGDLVLVKASRVARLERVAAALTSDWRMADGVTA